MSKKLKVRVRLVHQQKRATHENSWQYCECGCGERFPSSELMPIPTGNEFHQIEMIHKDHLASTVGAK